VYWVSARDLISRDNILTVKHEVKILGFHLLRRRIFDKKALLFLLGTERLFEGQ
jgi:hypothetical protein